jgi:outer membrane DcaP-like protein
LKFNRLLCLVAAAFAAAPILSHSSRALADEAADLRQLKAEIAAERQALADERAALAEQRKRIDDALVSLEDQKVGQTSVKYEEASARGAAPLPVVAAPTPPSKPGAYLDVYGFLQLDAIYDFNRVDPAWNATLRASKIPVICPRDPGCGNDGETILSVRQSRLGFDGFIPTAAGDIKTKFEFDLFGVGADAGNTTMRIRHMWGELGQWGAGQTNSLFTTADLFPNVVDYWGPPGMAFLRNPQIRWTPIADENWKIAVALEAPGAGIDAGRAALIDPGLTATPWNKYPDVTGMLRYADKWGHLQFSTLLRSIGVEGTLSSGAQFHSRVLGWGLLAGNSLEMGSLVESLAGDQLISTVVYGYGIANYMNDGGVDVAPDAGLDTAAVPTLGWMLYYNRTWNEHWTSSLGYSQHIQFNIGGQTGTAMKQLDYMSINALWHPVPQMFVGPEILWGKRKNEDSNDKSDTRVQVSFHYDFDGRIGPK